MRNAKGKINLECLKRNLVSVNKKFLIFFDIKNLTICDTLGKFDTHPRN